MLSFSTLPQDFPVVESRWEGVKREVHSPCIFGKDLVNISITGSGTINGNGAPWWEKHRNHPEQLEHPRPTLIGLSGCGGYHWDVADDSLSWTVNPMAAAM
jgi:hypothetical protein